MGFLTSIAIGALIAGTAAKAKGQHAAGAEAKRVGDVNAALAEQEAIDAARRGRTEEGDFRTEVRKLIGTQRAGYAGQNVDVGTGTAAAMANQTERLLQSDLQRMRWNAEREALGYKAEAAESRRQGKAAQRAARWGVASTILGGATETLLATRQGWKDRQERREQKRTGRTPSTGGGGWEE